MTTKQKPRKSKYSDSVINKVEQIFKQYGPTKAAKTSGIPRSTIHDWAREYEWTHSPDKLDPVFDPVKLEQHADDISRLVVERDKARAELGRWKILHAKQASRAQELEELFGLPLADQAPTISYIKPRKPGRREGVAVLVASDWHVEEVVLPEHVNGLNEYNQDVAIRRAETFFASAVRLLEIFQRDMDIDTVVVALLGDFITNDLHHDSAESNAVPPVDAAMFARDLIASGLQYILDRTKVNLVIPCHSGNHGRITHKVHSAHESGHSLEYMMYRSLEQHFTGNRMKWLVSKSYHSYLDVCGLKIRFHHGHGMRYAGGIGGLYIPVGQAIRVWNRTQHADLDVFGHFHQQRDGGAFLCNGSMIGYSAYSLRSRYEYESPRQTMFLVDSHYGKTATWPIVLEKTLDTQATKEETDSDQDGP
jgi:hypothetical protein